MITSLNARSILTVSDPCLDATNRTPGSYTPEAPPVVRAGPVSFGAG